MNKTITLKELRKTKEYRIVSGIEESIKFMHKIQPIINNLLKKYKQVSKHE